jgi:hypothetical protein
MKKTKFIGKATKTKNFIGIVILILKWEVQNRLILFFPF